ncbi:MAG: two-component regulator propeller domain-containing protein, partial [Candidatus Cryptobacteroides sp.]
MQQIGQKRKFRYLVAGLFVLVTTSSNVCRANEIFRSLSQETLGNKSVFSTVYDRDGYLWFGTSEGVVRYDGYRTRTYRYDRNDSLSLVNDVVNVMLAEGSRILMGTDSGLSIYDCDTDRFIEDRRFDGKHIKALTKIGDWYLAGTTSGLYTWHDGSVMGKVPGLPSDHISCIVSDRERIFAGAYGHIYELDRENPLKVLRIHKLPGLSPSTLVLAICGTKYEDRLMVGAENGMWLYDTERSRMLERPIRDIPVKAFLRHREKIWIGSDNGLFIRDRQGITEEYHHRVGDLSSLPNDVVWCIGRDGQDNLILGTDHGASIVETDQDFHFTPINNLADSDAGLDIGVMLNDGRGNLWLGGKNGLIRYGKNSSERFFADSGPSGKRL